MFVLNVKLNLKKFLAIVIAISILTAASIEFISNKKENESINTVNSNNNYNYILTEKNYISILETIHNDIDNNVNKTIKISGFVYIADDFKENTFVCGMNTITNNVENVAGILCNSKDTSSLKENEWVEITGIITKGDYHGTMPIIKVGSIKKIPAPPNTYTQGSL